MLAFTERLFSSWHLFSGKYLVGLLGVVWLASANSAYAHSFGQTYTMPVPVWLYLYGAAAALVISFVLVGYFVSTQSIEINRRQYYLSRRWTPRPAIAGFLLSSLRGLFVFLLALAIIAGFIGTQNAYRNLNMTLFWVVFVLGFTYLTALFGNWFAVLNPLRVIAEWIEKLAGRKLQGRWPYPQKLAYWPALILYMGFIWLELFGRSTPMSLSVVLLGYTLISLLGSYLLGKEPWFKYCEFFSVFLRLVAKMAPLAIDAPDGKFQKAYLRMPLAGLLQQKAIPLSLLVFVLFMLSSTAFDGLHETALWVGAFWKNLYQMLLFPIYGSAPPVTLPTIRKLFLIYQSGALLLSPLVYLVIYALFLFIAKVLIRPSLSLKALLTWFAYSLLPIVIAYHFTHYYTLLQIQGPQTLRLASDPFGFGWDLFGTAKMAINIVPDMGVVWHSQVLVIVAGHIASVYLAHVQAMALFQDRRAAIISQLPILVLMVVFTTLGLWILSLPLNPGTLGG